MASLQDQSDAAFREGQNDTLAQQAAAELVDDQGLPEIDFADDPDYPAPRPLQYSGDAGGSQLDTTEIEFEDDETTPSVAEEFGEPTAEAQPTQGQQPRTPRRPTFESIDDIHAPLQSADETSQPTREEGLSDSLVSRARRYGLHPAQIQNYQSNAQLEAALFQLDQAALLNQPQVPQQQQPQQYWQQPMQQPVQPQPQQQQPQTQPQQTEVKPEDLQYVFKHVEDIPDEYAEDMKGLNAHQAQLFGQLMGRVGELQGQLQQTQQFLQSQRQDQQRENDRRFVSDFDKKIQSLGDEWADDLGRGDIQGLDPYGVPAFHRKNVLRHVVQLIETHRRNGRQMGIDDVLESALRFQFPNRQGSVNVNQPAQQPAAQQPQPQQRGQSYTARPVRRQAQPKQISREERVNRMWDAHAGITRRAGYGDEADSLI